MLDEVIALQSNAVQNIIEKLKTKKEVTFKAPTGAGKTHIMAELMNKILREKPDTVFIVSSLSKGDLAKQNYEKFMDYSSDEFRELNPYLISSVTAGEEAVFIPETYNVYVLPRDLYKEKSKIKDGGTLAVFLYITSNQCHGFKDVYLIKDECHIATSNLDELLDNFVKVINISATPKLSRGQLPDVEITESQAEDCKLIKRVVYGDDDDDVDVAFDKLLDVQEQYINCDFNIKPCLIIQISNKDKATEQITELKSLMSLKYPDLHWCIIVDKDKDCETNDKVLSKLAVSKWKDEVKKNTSTVDVIIFKMVITEGWDIPRACILFQIRDSKSKQLDEQVIGRVRRNPKLLTFETLDRESQKIATTAYVWGINLCGKANYREVKLVGEESNNVIQQELTVITTRLKEILEVNTFDLDKFIQEQPKNNQNENKSIFEIYSKCRLLKGETKKLYESYVQDVKTWEDFTNNLDAIDKKVKDIEADYATNMEIVKDENGMNKKFSIPYKSSYIDGKFQRNIDNWIWERTDGETDFNFDASAEKKWFEILWKLRKKNINSGNNKVIKKCSVDGDTIFLIGKNYLDNSDIKFEYYLYGIHASYPDFIMKDTCDRIHLFESKSLNEDYDSGITSDEYKEKIEALKKCYLYASKLVPYYFYVPVLNGEIWEIHQYFNGEYKLLNVNTFEEFMQIGDTI